MENRMDEFISWLNADLTHFVSLVEEGSTVTGDPWQEGFSDHDITIIISEDQDTEMKAVYAWLQQHPFDDSYLFGPRLAHEFVHGGSLNDISMKFRAKVISGKDLVAEKDLPDRAEAIGIGLKGLRDLEMRCVRRLLNLSFWTLEYAQKKNYEILKNFFVFQAARTYGEAGEYPVTREDVVNTLGQQRDLSLLLQTTNNIGSSTKDDLKGALESAIAFIRNI